MKCVAAYIRVSTDGQVGDDKYGLEAQKAQIIKYCDENDYLILRWYSDEGESGAKYRPGFDELVYGDASNPPYEAVVVSSSDRVARDINIYFYYKGALLRKNIELISVNEDFGEYGAFAPMFEAFTMVCAQMEREHINFRTASGRKAKAEKGGFSGGRPPMGYTVMNGNLFINPDEAKIVRAVFRLRDAEGLSYNNICEALNELGFTNKLGKPLGIGTIQAILNKRKFYEGWYKYGESDWVKGQHEAILKPDEFVQENPKKKSMWTGIDKAAFKNATENPPFQWNDVVRKTEDGHILIKLMDE